FWTAACALALIFVQWVAVARPANVVGDLYVVDRYHWFKPNLGDVFFLFVLGVAALTVGTRRPMVEALPAAGVSSSGLLLIAFPLSFAVRLHGIPLVGPQLLLFALVVIWVGDTAAYFVGRAIGLHKLAPELSPKKTWEGTAASLLGSL